jgi:hypothetical protein
MLCIGRDSIAKRAAADALSTDMVRLARQVRQVLTGPVRAGQASQLVLYIILDKLLLSYLNCFSATLVFFD